MKTLQKTVLTALAPLLLVMVVACSSGGDGGTDDTGREITNEQLAQMVLELGQFGPEYARFAPETDNGLLDLEKAAAEEDDVDAERADLQQFGFSSAYKSFYSHPDFPGDGIFSLGGIIYMFESSDGAADYFADSVAELAEEQGDAEVTFDSFETRDLDVGDEGIEARINGQVRQDDGTTVPLWVTMAYMRRGRLIGGLVSFGLQVEEGEQARMEDKITSLSSVMNDRIASVLASNAPPAAAAQ